MPAAPALATRGSGRGGSATTKRRIGAWLLSLVVLAGVVAGEVAFLRDRIGTDIGILLDAGRSGAAQPAPRKPDGLSIAAPAPPTAGAITAVDLRALTACAPAAPCAVRLEVRLDPRPDPQTVTWSYRVVDRCTGAAGTAPGGTVTVPAGATRADVTGTVPLPDAPAVALLAVTEVPASAASPPVLVGTCLASQ